MRLAVTLVCSFLLWPALIVGQDRSAQSTAPSAPLYVPGPARSYDLPRAAKVAPRAASRQPIVTPTLETVRDSKPDNSDRLLRAADELEAAGLTEDAARYRAQARQLNQHQVLAQLQRLEAELARLQREINLIRSGTGTASQLLFQISVVEIDRGRLAERKLELPWETATDTPEDDRRQGIRRHVFAADDLSWRETLDQLQRDGLIKVLAAPKLMTLSGREASFMAGGEIALPTPLRDNPTKMEFKRFGTELKLLSHHLANGRIRLDVDLRLSELDFSRRVLVDDKPLPDIRVRQLTAGAELESGQTLLLSGLVRQRATVVTDSDDAPETDEVENAGDLLREPEQATAAEQASDSHVKIEELESLFIITPRLVESTVEDWQGSASPPSPPQPAGLSPR